jgi:hypothetical protein
LNAKNNAAKKANAMRLVTKSMSRPASDVLRSLPSLLVLMLVAIFLAENVKAQLVVVGRAGGVRVRAPFVSVDVLPFARGTHIRVPFATIDTGFYRSYRTRRFPPAVGVFPLPVPYPYAYPYAVASVPTFPVIAVPAYPNAYGYEYPEVVYPEVVYPEVVYPGAAIVGQPVHEGAYSSNRPRLEVPLPERLRGAAERLARTLSLREDGDVWLNYLGPQRIIENVDYGRSPSELQDLILNYDGVVSNGTLRSIQFARGFIESRDLLRQYLRETNRPRESAVNRAAAGTQLPVEPADFVPKPPAPLPPAPLPPASLPPASLPPAPRIPVQPAEDTPAKPAAPAEQSRVSGIQVGSEQVPRVSRGLEKSRAAGAGEMKITPTSL